MGGDIEGKEPVVEEEEDDEAEEEGTKMEGGVAVCGRLTPPADVGGEEALLVAAGS